MPEVDPVAWSLSKVDASPCPSPTVENFWCLMKKTFRFFEQNWIPGNQIFNPTGAFWGFLTFSLFVRKKIGLIIFWDLIHLVWRPWLRVWGPGVCHKSGRKCQMQCFLMVYITDAADLQRQDSRLSRAGTAENQNIHPDKCPDMNDILWVIPLSYPKISRHILTHHVLSLNQDQVIRHRLRGNV